MPAEPPKGAGPGQGPEKGSGRPCPICGKPAKEASRPFCSERCRDVDLNRWLSNSYAIPGRTDEDEDGDQG
jgi:endogenous inhibitor of DNA gyrase (YacG/DUF329 family)